MHDGGERPTCACSDRSSDRTTAVEIGETRYLDATHEFEMRQRSCIGQVCSKPARLHFQLAWNLVNDLVPKKEGLKCALSHAGSLAAQLIRQEVRLRDLEAACRAFESLNIGYFLFDAHGGMIFSNGAAQDLTPLDAQTGQKLTLTSEQILEMVRRALERKVGAENLELCTKVSFALKSGHHRPAYVRAHPAGSDNDATRISVFVPTDMGRPVARALEIAYDLTPSEALVAARIACGGSLRQAAEDLSLSVETTRTYSKRAYSKLGVSRQSELVAQALLISLPGGSFSEAVRK